jgi:hypothetical protein
MSPHAPSSISVSSDDEVNPLMTLVDAASSILDKTAHPTTSSVDQAAQSSESASITDSYSAPEDQGRTSSPAAHSPSNPENREASPLLDKKLSFAEQLMAMLDDEVNCGVIAWMPDGKAFTIINPKRFTKVEMPTIFNIRNMSSFVRKLTRWGFHRKYEKETMNSDIFKHKEFHRGNYDLCSQIKCLGRNPVTPSIPKQEALKQVMGSKTQNMNTKTQQRLPSSPASVCSTPSPTPSDTVPQYKTSLNYLDEACRFAHIQKHILKANPLPFSFSTSSDAVSDVLALAIESLRREQAPLLMNASSDRSLAANALALQNILEASHQRQLAHMAPIPSWLTTNANARLGAKTSWGGFSSLY